MYLLKERYNPIIFIRFEDQPQGGEIDINRTLHKRKIVLLLVYICTRSKHADDLHFSHFRLNDAYGGRPVITYRDLDAPRDGDEY